MSRVTKVVIILGRGKATSRSNLNDAVEEHPMAQANACWFWMALQCRHAKEHRY